MTGSSSRPQPLQWGSCKQPWMLPLALRGESIGLVLRRWHCLSTCPNAATVRHTLTHLVCTQCEYEHAGAQPEAFAVARRQRRACDFAGQGTGTVGSHPRQGAGGAR
jgi:hypothetical protein